jgi:Uma2 family endonuclease
MSAAAVTQHLTPDEYLAFERAAEGKHEYCDGQVFAMAGCNRRHDTIASRVIGALDRVLETSACQPFTSDMRVHIPATGLFTYTDGLVACEPSFTDEREDTLTNPVSIFEVLSDSTEAYDRGKKFENYRGILSLRDYVLISQHKVLVEHFTRQPDGRWLLQELRAPDVLRLSAVPVEIPVQDLYKRVFKDLPPPTS